MDIDTDAICKALAAPVRREFLHWLRAPHRFFREPQVSLHDGVCVGDFESTSGLSQSTVSAHLAILRKARLVTRVKVGQWVLFKRNEAVIRAFIAHLERGL